MVKRVIAQNEDILTNEKQIENTLIANIESVIDIVSHNRSCRNIYVEADTELSYLAKRLKITKKQAFLFSLFIECSLRLKIDIESLARICTCSRVHILSLLSEDQALINRGLVCRAKDRRNNDNIVYKIPIDVIDAIKNNEIPEHKKNTLTNEEFFIQLEQVFDETEYEYYSFPENIKNLIDDNMHLQFCKAYRKYFSESDDAYDGGLFMLFANYLINEEDDYIGEHDWVDYFPKLVLQNFGEELTNKTSYLLTHNLIVEVAGEGLCDTPYFRISDNAKEEFFADMDITTTIREPKIKELQSYNTLTEKELFYNVQEYNQISRLSSLVSINNFDKVQKRMEENGMRKGFACLFYGAPGTGKTETVYQLALKTKRDLFVIDVAQIKSCWVGESEKNISLAFLKYNTCVKRCRQNGKNIPILLFNEADAVLGLRNEKAEKAIDKMENSIQNIILQEMEHLEGIMIATTNLSNNLDKAFERRFIYKIEFNNPSTDVKEHIWCSMIPKLSHKVAKQLANDYDFSGGQIENVARKCAVEKVLTGKKSSTKQINDFCKEELLNNKRTKIGFQNR